MWPFARRHFKALLRDSGSLPAPRRPASPFPFAMRVAARWRAPIPLLPPAAERGPARLPAPPRAVPLAPIAAQAQEEVLATPTTQQLQQWVFMTVSATGHVRSADGREVDDHAKAWQKSEQRSAASATDRRAQVATAGRHGYRPPQACSAWCSLVKVSR